MKMSANRIIDFYNCGNAAYCRATICRSASREIVGETAVRLEAVAVSQPRNVHNMWDKLCVRLNGRIATLSE